MSKSDKKQFPVIYLILSVIMPLLCSLLPACGGGLAGSGDIEPTTVEGRVFRVNGQLFEGATITVVETGDFAVTNSAGEFSIQAAISSSELSLAVQAGSVDKTVVIDSFAQDVTKIKVDLQVDEAQNSVVVIQQDVSIAPTPTRTPSMDSSSSSASNSSSPSSPTRRPTAHATTPPESNQPTPIASPTATPIAEPQAVYGDCALDSITGPSSVVIGSSQVYQVQKKNLSSSTLVCHTDIQITLIQAAQSGDQVPGAGFTRVGNVDPGATSSSRVDFNIFVSEDFQWVPGRYEISACTYSLGFLGQQNNSTGKDDNESNRCDAVRFDMISN